MLWLAAYLTGVPPVGLHILRWTHCLTPMCGSRTFVHTLLTVPDPRAPLQFILFSTFDRQLIRPRKKIFTKVIVTIIQMFRYLCYKIFKIVIRFQMIRFCSFAFLCDHKYILLYPYKISIYQWLYC